MSGFPGRAQPGRGRLFSTWSAVRARPLSWAAAPGRGPAASPALQEFLTVHLIWEGGLFVVMILLVGAAVGTTHGAHLSSVVSTDGYLGFLAAGLALSLRTASPNLAVGSIATTTGVLGAHLATADGWSLWGAMTLAVVLATAAGLITGLLVAALSVPAWATSLGVAFLLQGVAQGISGGQPIVIQVGSYPTLLWVAIFAVVSVAGGALCLVPEVRSALGAARGAAGPGQRAGRPARLGCVAGLTGSSFLAGVGGVSMVASLHETETGSAWLSLTVAALAAVLIGGVSVFGVRAGLLGTVLGVVIVSAVLFLCLAHGFSALWLDGVTACLVVLGLGVSWAVESLTEALRT